MMVDPKLFLDALVVFMASAAGLGASPRPLWANEAISRDADDPHSVLRIYDGSQPYVPVTNLAIQCATHGKMAAAAMTRASLLYQTLLDADNGGRPLRMCTVTAGDGQPVYRINSVDPRVPGFIGIDENNRSIVAFNIDLNVVRIS